MAVQRFAATNFRCLERVTLELDPKFNLIHGPNASGKTSVLEALGYLGRGKSFRGAASSDLVRYGEKEFVLFGELSPGRKAAKIGVRNSHAGLEVRIDGANNGGAAALAAVLPLQIIEPDVHNLVAGSPDQRRRYLDWIAFHVEHGYLDAWRRFRRALKQRNAALRAGAGAAAIAGWNTEFAELAVAVDAGRRAALAASADALEETGLALLGSEVAVKYRSGWNDDRGLIDSLQSGLERDRQLGSTQTGPHRGDLQLNYDTRKARMAVSRGQQKLLACAMILAATATAQAALGQPILLLLDDPAAELDGDALVRLMDRIVGLGCQIVATSLDKKTLLFPEPAAVFHVEHGALVRAAGQASGNSQ